MKETVWSPDTCGCRLVYEWDETLPDTSRVHTFKRAEVICSFHQGMVDNKTSYDSALDHNQRKNKVEGALLSQLTSVLADTNPEGSLVWKNGIKFNWSFSGNGDSRVLTISVSGITLTTNQKNIIQNWCNTNLGTGKVLVT